MLYLTIFIVVSILAFLNLFLKDEITLYLPVVALVIIAAFRSVNVGPDTITYVQFYNFAKNGISATPDFEKGYVFLQNIFASNSAPIWLFFGIIAIISLYSVMRNYRMYTTLPAFAFLYYFSRFFLNRDLNQIRSGVASSLVLFSIKYLEERKFYKFLLVILIAAQFHTAAYVMIVVYPVNVLMSRIKRGGLVYSLVLLITAVLSLKVSGILSTVFSLLGRGSVYISYDGYVEGAGFFNPVLMLQIVLSLIAVFFYYQDRDKVKEEQLGVLSVYVVSTVALLALNQYAVLAGRLSTVLATVEPIILIGVMKRLVPKAFVPLMMIVASFLILFVIYFNTGQIEQFFEPYVFSFAN